MDYLSFLMGASRIGNQELEHIGIKSIKETESGSRKLKIPSSSLKDYKTLVIKKLDLGFWNDIVGKDKIIFIFKLKDGEIKEYILNEENLLEIAELCSSLNGDSIEKTSDIYNYLASNEFYRAYIKLYHLR